MIRFFADHPTAANVLMVAIMILGLVAAPQLQRDTFPVIPSTEVEIRVRYPGATPAEIEDTVCQRLEDALDSVSDLIEVRCDARESLAIAVAGMRETADMDDFFGDVKSQVDAISTFPDRVETPSIVELERTAVVASVAITGDMTPANLKAYAERVKERFEQDRRIAQVRLLGFSDQEISIEIPAGMLRRYGLSVSDIASTIERQSIDLPMGTMETRGGDLIVRFADQRRTPSEFSDLIVVSGRAGGQVRLGDIATIKGRFERAEEKILFNGKRAALLEISKTTSQDTLRTMEVIQENLKRHRRMAPRGVSLEISQDVTSNIRDRLRILFQNGVAGLILVFFTMWVFFSLRFSFWVAMGLPVSFLGAVFAMHFLGYTINMITMVALLVSIGLLMDSAIVISENIAAKVRKGGDIVAATVEGVQQVLPGVLSSFLTTIMIVGPLAFMAGRMGAVLKYLPAVLVITLVVSLVEAFLILPAHLRHSLTRAASSERSTFHTWFDGRFDIFRDRVFGRLIDGSLRNPYATLGIIAALVLVSYATIPAGMLKYRAFPELESDIVQARILLPQGTSLARTEQVVEKVTNALKDLDEEFSERQEGDVRLVRNISALFGVNVGAFENGPHLATISADLLRAEKRIGTVDEILDRWRILVGDVSDVVSLKFTDKERGVAGKAVDIRLHGNNMKQLKNASMELQAWLSGFVGVVDLSDDLRPGKPEIRIRLREGASTLGISATDIANEVRAALQGGTSLDVQVGREAYDVAVRLDAGDRDELDDLRYLLIRSREGNLIPVSAIADIEQVRGYSRIHRVNGQRTITVQGKLDTRKANARELMKITKKRFLAKLKKKYPGIRVSFQGQGKETAATGNSLQTNVLIGLAGVFLILCFQFRSYVQPIAVMLAIPTGLVGVVWGHLALGLDLSMPSLVGLATLAGIVVNNSILLVAFIKDRRLEGTDMRDAARMATRDRFRAIVLTSLTTIAGLLPLLMETSTQAQLLIPLVASIAFGLFAATILSLFLVPAFFGILADFDLDVVTIADTKHGQDARDDFAQSGQSSE
jgi:hydrophobic/amphiphilic exporter-1 (mainly G- bacteria), HAE1 family